MKTKIFIGLMFVCSIIFACNTTTQKISDERAAYLEKKYVGIDRVAFSTEEAYIKHFDLYDRMVTAILKHSRTHACSPMDNDQYWNEVWKEVEPERKKFIRFCSLHYVNTTGFENSFKQANYEDLIKLRAKYRDDLGCIIRKYDGKWEAISQRTTLKSKKGASCSELAVIIFTIHDSQISGIAKDSQGLTYEISGYVESSGQITGALAIGGNTVAGITGKLSGTSGDGTYKTVNGCSGTWSCSKTETREADIPFNLPISTWEGTKCPSAILLGGYYNEFKIGTSTLDYGKAVGKIVYKITKTETEYLISGKIDLGDAWFTDKPTKKYVQGVIASGLMDQNYTIISIIASKDYLQSCNSQIASSAECLAAYALGSRFKIQIMHKHVNESELKYIFFQFEPVMYR